MRKSTILVLILLGISLSLAPTKSSNDSDIYFNDWRPNTDNIGCHTAGLVNTQVPGIITFDQDLVVVDAGDTFTISLSVEGFGGNFSADNIADDIFDVTIGLNILDGDNADFLETTINEINHKIINGNSVIPYEASFTVEAGAGNYSLIAYAVSGDTGFFNWITGQFNVQVLGEIAPTYPVVNVTASQPVDDIVSFDFDFNGATNIENVTMAIDSTNLEDYSYINVTESSYDLNVSSYAPNNYTAYFNVTNAFNLSIIVSVAFEVSVPPVITTPTTTTPITTPPPKTDPSEIEEPGALGTPVSVFIILVIGISIVGVTIVVSRKF